MGTIRSTRGLSPVDLAPQYVGTTLYAQDGSPLITRQNTVTVAVKDSA